jgi:hypothetical protein
MVSAAQGAEQFYSIEDHSSRSEGLELARERDTSAAQVNIFRKLKSSVTISIYLGLGWSSLYGCCGQLVGF